MRCCGGSGVVLAVLVNAALLAAAATLPLEREWDYYVRRVSIEIDALRRAETASASAKWKHQVATRIAAAEDSLRINAAFVEMLLECATEWNSLDAFDPEWSDGGDTLGSESFPVEKRGKLEFERTSLDWDACDSHGAGYTSIDELFAHMYRDFDRLRERRHHAATLRSVAEAVDQRRRSPRSAAPVEVLVLGAGVCGLVHAVARLPGVRVTATECSPVFMHGCRCALLRERNASLVPWLGLFGSAAYGSERDQFEPSSIEMPGLPPSADVTLVQADALHTKPIATERSFDVVVTSYFVDAAVSSSVPVFQVLDRIAQLVKPHGYWVNCGPLQYHKMDVLPKLTVRDVIAYVTDGQGYFDVSPESEGQLEVLQSEDYSRSSETSLSVNSFRAALFQLKRR